MLLVNENISFQQHLTYTLPSTQPKTFAPNLVSVDTVYGS